MTLFASLLRGAAVAFPLAAAEATPATQAEADRLTQVFETYLGKPEGGAPRAVTVAPEGEHYRASIDVARVLKPLEAFDVKVAAAEPYVLTLSPLPDGTWHMTEDGFPQLGITSGKGISYSFALKDAKADAIFDPKLKSVSRYVATNVGTRQMTRSPKATQQTDVKSDHKTTVSASGPSADAVSSMAIIEDKAVAYDVTSTPTDETHEAPIHATATVGSSLSTTSADNQRVAKLLDLWAFIAAHSSVDALKADAPLLKEKARAVLPYATRFAASVEGNAVAVEMPRARFAFAQVGERLAIGDSTVPDGLLFGVSVSGLTLPPTLVPRWARNLVPTDVSLTLKAAPVDLSAGARVLIDDYTVGRTPPLSNPQLLDAAAALSGGKDPILTLEKTVLSNAAMSVSAEGSARLSTTAPSAHFLVKAKGLARTIETLSAAAADEPMAAGVLRILSVAQAMAHDDGDGVLSWTLDESVQGLTVNGTPLR